MNNNGNYHDNKEKVNSPKHGIFAKQYDESVLSLSQFGSVATSEDKGEIKSPEKPQ